MKIGIFSGTFDPVHSGHITLANAAVDETGLDKLIFLPEAVPRRKEPVAPLRQRIGMLKLAVGETPKKDVFSSDVESHSVAETMNELHGKYGSDNDYYLVMGADVFEHIESWNGYRQLLSKNSVILALRTEDDGELAVERAGRLNIKPTMLVSSYPSVSSSKIRSALKRGEEPEGLPDKVLDYVKANKLYE